MLRVIKGKKIKEGEQKRPKPTGGLGIRTPDEDDIDGGGLPPVLPPGVRGAPLPHPQPSTTTSAAASADES